MGKTEKKNSKGRLDKYYHLAKEKGYRARSSFKVIQVNEKFGHFLEKSKVVIDLCAAPGSWCQVASKLCPVNSLILGVDIVPMKPMPNVITFQSDITTEDCRSKLRGYMKTWKADTVLHDGAPNVGLGWVQDAFTQSQLTLQALRLAVENLVVNGTFVTKIFRSKDYNKLMWVFQQLFEKVEATKPPASRNVSAEIFVVCRGFKAPKRLDPRLLDPKEVFEELPDKPHNMEIRVFNPEKHIRKREGYEEGDTLLYHELPIMEFVQHEDPIYLLGYMNKFTIDENDHNWKIVKKLKQTNGEFFACIEDLKVLGKKEFKMILKWRKAARELLGIEKKEEEAPKIEVEPLNEEEQIDKELQNLQEKQRLEQKRERRRRNEAKMREIHRMQMNMLTPGDLGIEAAEIGRESFFNLKTAEKTGILDKLAKGKKRMIPTGQNVNRDDDLYVEDGVVLQDKTDNKEADDLEAELDEMYNQYKLRKAERDTKFKAKQARGGDTDEWDGFQEGGGDNEAESDGELQAENDEESSDDDSDNDEAINNLISRLKGQSGDQKLSNRAKMLFNDPIFDNVQSDLPSETSTATQTPTISGPPPVATSQREPVKNEDVNMNSSAESGSESDNSDFEIVPAENHSGDDDSDYDSDAERQDSRAKSHAQDVDIATVEAMTLAHQLALGQKTKHELVDEGFNRYAFRDQENLPEWFVEDEKQHSKINRPITKEAAAALKEKMKALNARPIKKVAEAKARKRMRSVQRLERIKKKAGLIVDESEKSEKDKADEISSLMRKVSKKEKPRPKPTLVVAKGSNRGVSGRPKGVKGKYRMVDGVMKNEKRALKRIAKKHHKRR
ncbi:AdoMet-dependent rRNA methyltransferase spb1 [Zygosaccharomyces mellis]|uniref:AdoMet-dependent rRNA methyltransferase spb1 n=1 Tax=Zygosaccharomyces mellis TaxID=42258 RepID=A0A4C2E8J9_9SACH|nr:AdoMet-dependent rRNA methyltransferase spb1 [Zygosaccharomyces mellis]